MIEIEYDKESG